VKVYTTTTPPPDPDPTPKPGPVVPPVTNQDPAPVAPVQVDDAATPPPNVTVASAPTLTAAKARSAMRSLLANRLRGWTLSAISCTTTDSRHARCTFRARNGDRRATGTGALVLVVAERRVTVTVKANLTGPRGRNTTWHGRTRS
jgi:hypothetical protein